MINLITFFFREVIKVVQIFLSKLLKVASVSECCVYVHDCCM